MKILTSAGILLCGLYMSAAGAQPQGGIESVDFDTVEYQTSLRWPAVRTAIITGNPQAAGLYTTHAWMAADAIVPPHTHPDPRITVVTHGTMYVGVGAVYDEAKLVAYPQGSVFITPADVPHYMRAKDGAVAVLDSGAGPTGIGVLTD